MAITCQAILVTRRPLPGMPISLRCLDQNQHCFDAVTDEEGKVTNWFSSRDGWAQAVSIGQALTTDKSQWRLCFETRRFLRSESNLPHINVDFCARKNSHCDVQLVLDESPSESYLVLIDESYPSNAEGHTPTSQVDSPLNQDPDDLWLSGAVHAAEGLGSETGSSPAQAESPGPVPLSLEDVLGKELQAAVQGPGEGMTTRHTTSYKSGISVGESSPRPQRAESLPVLPATPYPTHTPTSIRRSERLRLRQAEKDGDYIPLD